MYLFNDMELLFLLTRLNILNTVRDSCHISLAGAKQDEYTYQVTQIIKQHPEFRVLHTDDGFFSWVKGKLRLLTIGDLSTIYIGMTHPGTTIVLSEDDSFLEFEAKNHQIACMPIEAFIKSIAKDERTIQLYNLLKIAQ